MVLNASVGFAGELVACRWVGPSEYIQRPVAPKTMHVRGRPREIIWLTNRGSAVVDKNVKGMGDSLAAAVDRGLLPARFRAWGIDYVLSIKIPVGAGKLNARVSWKTLMTNVIVQTTYQVAAYQEDDSKEFERKGLELQRMYEQMQQMMRPR
jgi:hypothetical protein